MTKTLMTAALFAAAASVANAQPMPAPPTAKYTAPVAASCAAQSLQIYFPAGETALTTASEAMLAQAKETLDGCIIGPVSIQAIAADAPSTKTANRLAEARLISVTTALDQYRLAGSTVDTDVATIAPTVLSAPNDRKVEIRLSAWSPEIS